MAKHFRLALMLILVAGLQRDAVAQSDRIVITEEREAYVLTVPVSQLKMTIPREGFRQGDAAKLGATASRRYFYFEDRTKHIAVSGWFEADSEFTGMAEFWKGEVAAWSKEKLPEPTNVVFKKIGGWDAILYQMPRASGSNANIRAEWLAAGTWIDLHASVDSESPATENVALLESLLSRIRVSEK
jgi:hypothetical protein